MRMRVGLVPLLLIAMLVLSFPLSASASVPVAAPAGALGTDDGPAVEVPPAEEEEDEQPWTSRYLAPTTLLLGALALGGSILYYGIRIRGRYKVAP